MQIKQQVLLIWGRHDEILSPSLADKWQAALGPSRCKLVSCLTGAQTLPVPTCGLHQAEPA
jgi:pimeloyl-ACP methyl ester carboxylesterase